ncbi:bifunctional UDP-N-acetylglucosamine diphosphorylase/glucosamine-1-phosphate N-acetyltransferase GlmU [Candidatus Nitrosacidococcus tergens]|uniref:Bifunctional protein GlmU n=1 Tax=Candidatus Nitrosacidococcus tergens TaxID=553981 RepID=A0A7G1QBU1_9GAMM|nr:bifunctional UDP-N-acetylglucosamine diphosphorylase/glucosamine-1-phosphate N-acetyltransferase GlmU [Candidatus Nitrosacidococcus tergens]CAB1277626.1 fused N-acetyl glucosamine-1-phosphate uridyltransferase; glucosamine-1-phosphate acetyl transferase [Candidatus Nitrosacidococcus tergens]
MSVSVIILAAGQGKRMRSQLPKVLHKLAGQPLLSHIVTKVRQLTPKQIIIVYGHGGALVSNAIKADDITWVQQKEQLGTGHAVLQALPYLQDNTTTLILVGDVPLINTVTLRELLSTTTNNPLGLITANLDNPTGLGRIIRNSTGSISAIVEEADANSDQLKIKEINTGIIAIQTKHLKKVLPHVKNYNAQKEYYLTDIVSHTINGGDTIATVLAADPIEVIGINDRKQLSYLERAYQIREADRLMEQGVSFCDPNRFDLRGTIKIGQDVYIDANVILEGEITLGDNVIIGPNCYIRDTYISSGVQIFANCVIEEAIIDSQSKIGPFARIRPESKLGKQVHIGNFVEIKKSNIADRSKINHLSYIGDTLIGKNVNVGAGTITCNYDGVNKYQTIIEDNVFIGSDTQLIAPVTIGAGATIGAGTTITKDAPPDKLTLSRVPQKTHLTWKRSIKNPNK